jgi:hypothetical protein
MSVPPDLVRLIHVTLANHYRQYHRADDPNRAEIFAEQLGKQLLDPIVQADANRAVAHLDIQELPWVSSGADENYRLAGILRDALCREIRRWLEESEVFRYNVREKSRAYALAVAGAADGSTYVTAVENAKLGHMSADDPYEGLSEKECVAREAEERYQEGWRWR